MVDVSSRLADDKRNDFRIEAAIAKLYGSELGWEAVDTMVQVRGGRGYETAKSLAARGEKPVPAEQMLRDMRINRIFEGSTEIMHLLIAREAVDQHLQVAGDILLGDGGARPTRPSSRVKAGAFYAKWFPSLAVGEGQNPKSYDEFGDARQAPALRRAPQPQARPLDLLRDGPLPGQARAEGRAAGPHRRHRRRALRDRLRVHLRATRSPSETPSAPRRAFELADLFCKQARRRADALFDELWANDDDDQYERRAGGARRPLRVVRGGRPRPGRRRPDDPATRPRGSSQEATPA